MVELMLSGLRLLTAKSLITRCRKRQAPRPSGRSSKLFVAFVREASSDAAKVIARSR
jgi:hypothetical protein